MDKEFFTHVFSIALASVSSLSISLIYPDLISLSQSWDTNLQPLFILSNIVTAYVFFSLPNWRIPGVFLVLLTAFPYKSFFLAHDIFAILFFISVIYSLWDGKRLIGYIILLMFSLQIMLFSLLWGEVFAILILCTYHLHLLLYKRRLYNRNL